MSLTPKFQPGETMNIARYIPPLPKGATVTVKRIEFRGEEYQYVVEGRRVPQGDLIEVWADEIDLKAPLIFEAPRKKRRGSREMPSYSTVSAPVSAPVSANAAVPANATIANPAAMTVATSSNGATGAASPPRKRRSPKITEPVGIIPTSTGRSRRSQALESAMYAEPATPQEKPKRQPRLKQDSTSVPLLQASETAQTKPRPKRSSADNPADAALPTRAARSSVSSGGPTDKRKRTAKPARSAALTTRKKAAAQTPAKAAAQKRKKKKVSSATATSRRPITDTQAKALAAKSAGRARGKRKSVVEAQPVIEPAKRVRGSRVPSGASVGAILDGVLNGQGFPGGMVFGGGTSGVPVIIVIVNINGESSGESSRKRRS